MEAEKKAAESERIKEKKLEDDIEELKKKAKELELVPTLASDSEVGRLKILADAKVSISFI